MRLTTKHKGLRIFMSSELLGFDEPQPVWRAYRSVLNGCGIPDLEYVEGTAAGTLAECKAQIEEVTK